MAHVSVVATALAVGVAFGVTVPAHAGGVPAETCEEWMEASHNVPGYMMVVCDRRVLRRYRASDDAYEGPEELRIHDPLGVRSVPVDEPLVPEIFDTRYRSAWSRLVVSNGASARPLVYAAATLIDGSVIEARFRAFRMKARSRLTLRRGRRIWRLVGRDGGTVASARRRHRDIPSLNGPYYVGPERRAGALTVTWYADYEPIGTSFRIYGAGQPGGPWVLLRSVKAADLIQRVRLSGAGWIGVVRVDAVRGRRTATGVTSPVKVKG